jgi:HEAT repeat protein
VNRNRKIVAAAAVSAAVVAVVLAVGAGSRKPSGANAPTADTVEQHPSPALDQARLTELAAGVDGAEKLRAAFTATTDRAARVRILDAAALSPDRRALKLLVSVAASEDPLGAHAGAALGRMMHTGLVEDFAALAREHDSVLVRANAIRALANSRAKDQIELLAHLLGDTAEPMRVRQEAALALGQLGTDASATALAATLDMLGENVGVEQLRISIVQALGRIRTDSAMAALTRHRGRRLSSTEQAFVDRALARPVQRS